MISRTNASNFSLHWRMSADSCNAVHLDGAHGLFQNVPLRNINSLSSRFVCKHLNNATWASCRVCVPQLSVSGRFSWVWPLRTERSSQPSLLQLTEVLTLMFEMGLACIWKVRWKTASRCMHRWPQISDMTEFKPWTLYKPTFQIIFAWNSIVLCKIATI